MVDSASALDVITEYTAALMAKDSQRMGALHAPDFVLDWVYADAFETPPSSAQETSAFWPAFFAGFPEMDYQITRTVAAQEVVIVQWVFRGTHSGPLGPPVFETIRPPTGRTIRLRGISVYDVRENLIQRETTYMDLATLMVELGLTL
jgi:steroid delta-isomerase-like uncharacterized protein